MAKQRLNFSTYPQDYYTGAQAKIYFGSVWVDDIATIQYQTSHSKTPLYGYGDHQFRVVAKGQFMVRGSFTIAFKETGYMYSITKLVQADLNGTKLPGRDEKKQSTYLDYIGQGYTPEQALDLTAGTNTTDKIVGSNMNASADFEDIAEVLEDSIWGKSGTPSNLKSRIPRSDELDYYQYIGNDSGAAPNDIDRDSFDILLTFGDYRSGNDSVEHTMISLNGVHITGESMIVSPTAEPVGISYEFFARGLNERLGSSWAANAKIEKDLQDDKQNKASETAAKNKAAVQAGNNGEQDAGEAKFDAILKAFEEKTDLI